MVSFLSPCALATRAADSGHMQAQACGPVRRAILVGLTAAARSIVVATSRPHEMHVMSPDPSRESRASMSMSNSAVGSWTSAVTHSGYGAYCEQAATLEYARQPCQVRVCTHSHIEHIARHVSPGVGDVMV